MQAFGYNLKRASKNFIGRLFGYEKCVFCGDRANWKPWVELNISDPKENNKLDYELPVCGDCFGSQPLNEIMNAVKADITDDNNFCRSFGDDPVYSDADQGLIMRHVTQAKSKIAGVSRGTINSD